MECAGHTHASHRVIRRRLSSTTRAPWRSVILPLATGHTQPDRPPRKAREVLKDVLADPFLGGGHLRRHLLANAAIAASRVLGIAVRRRAILVVSEGEGGHIGTLGFPLLRHFCKEKPRQRGAKVLWGPEGRHAHNHSVPRRL
jgi:hypothetical protein